MFKGKFMTLALGVLIGALIIAGAQRLLFPTNFQDISWKHPITWFIFLSGFLGAFWLVLWMRFFAFLSNRKKAKKTEEAAAPVPASDNIPAKSGFVPARMTVQNNSVMNITPNPAMAQQNNTEALGAPVSAEPTQPSPRALKEAAIQELSGLCPDLDMMAFKHIAMGGKILDLVYSSDSLAILCTLLFENHTWTVDISQPIENCVWTDETGATSSPCLPLLSQAAVLEKAETEATILPTFVLMNGAIKNYEEVANYLLQNHISLVKYRQEEPVNALTLEDFLIQNFSLFPENEEEDEEESEEPEEQNASVTAFA